MGLLINEKYYCFASDMVVTMAGNWEKTLEMFKKNFMADFFFLKQSMLSCVPGIPWLESQDMGSLRGM